MLSFLLTWGLLTHFTPPVLCLALPTMTQFHDWSHSSWGSLSTSINGHWHCSLCLTYVFLPRSAVTSCYLRSSPILSGCSSRCPWQKLQLPIFHPREALLVGCQVTTLPLSSCGILFLSPLAEVVLHGVGLVHLSHVWWLPIQRECQSLMQWEEVGFSGGLMTFHVGSSLDKRGHLLQFDTLPPKSFLPTYSWSASFP